MLILVKFSADYSDEFDVVGHQVWNKDSWEGHLKEVEEYLIKLKTDYKPKSKWDSGPGLEMYFGTNEMITFNSFDEYSGFYKTRDLTFAEAETLKMLDLHKGGTFLTYDIEEHQGDDED